MIKIININDRGTLTLPRILRKILGIEAEGQVIAEETNEGILLRPSATFPIEMYSAERQAEFTRNNEEALKEVSFSRKK